MFDSPEFFALLAAFFSALMSIATTRAVRTKADPWGLLLVICLAGTLFVGVVLPPQNVGSLSISIWGLLILNGLMWVYGDFLAMSASKWIDPSVARIFGGLTQILVFLAGVFFFSESLSLWSALGASLILSALFIGQGLTWRSAGVALQAGSVLLVASARVYDTYLARELSPETITFTGYLMPTVLLAMLKPKAVLEIPKILKDAQLWGLVAVIASPLNYFFLMQALAHGELSTTTLIMQSSMIFILLLERVVLKTTAPQLPRIIACGVCMAGMAVLLLSK